MTSSMTSSNCPGCGTELEPLAFTGALSFLNSITAYCDECAAEKTAAIEREAMREDCRRRYFELHRLGLLTEAFRKASFSTSKPEVEAMNSEAWAFGRSWDRKKNVHIRGTMGSGKTHLALCMLRKAFVAGMDVGEVTARQFVKAADMFRDPKDMMRHWQGVDVLLLDDIDKAQWNLERIDALWELLNARISAGHRSIVTANVSLREIAIEMRERTGGDVKNTSRADAALERLKPIHQIEMKGKSLR